MLAENGGSMGKYLVRASYTAEGAKGLIKDGGSKRAQVVTDTLKSAGVTLESLYFALGDDDVYLIVDAPDHATMTAVALATNASGAVRLSTTVLLTPQEVDAAAKKTVNYTPPGR
jgi:uncharacterized protein with GYD domain